MTVFDVSIWQCLRDSRATRSRTLRRWRTSSWTRRKSTFSPGSSPTSSRTPRSFSRSTRPASRPPLRSWPGMPPIAPTRSVRRSTATKRCRPLPTPRWTPGSSKCRGSSDDRVLRIVDCGLRMARAMTIAEVRDGIRSRARSAVDVCRDALARIDTVNPQLNAFNTVVADRALARAEAIDAEPDRWRDAPLAGVPVAVKDNLCTRGVRTTASSRMLEHYVPPYDATVVARLERAGAVIVGKTNCDEFAMGSSNENSAFGPVRNPWALDRIPGGTSGGSAAAVAAGLTPLALGSDTGGSIRQPAALCGVVGLKPTYGRVSRYGLIAHASSLDQIGPLTRSAYDAALTLNVLAGSDPADATSATEPVPDYTAALTGDVRGLRIGVPRALLDQGIDEDVSRAMHAALDVLKARGAALVDVDLPHA